MNHVLFQRPFARLVWALSPIPAPPEDVMGNSLYSNTDHALNIKKAYPRDEVKSEMVPCLLWRLWKCRNELLFNGKEYEAMSILRKAREDADEWERRKQVNLSVEGNKRVTHPISTSQAKPWKLPPTNWLKCNSDGAWHKDRLNSGVGWLCRDGEGRLLCAGASVVTGLESSIRTEAEALQWADESMARFRYDKIIFESDSLSLVKMLNEEEEVWPMLLPVIEAICQALKQISSVEVRFYPRGGNKAANRIAKETFTFVSNVSKLYSVVPEWLKFQVESDKSCMVKKLVN